MIAQSLDVNNYWHFFKLSEQFAHKVIQGTELTSLHLQAVAMLFSTSNFEVKFISCG